jgi:hypothetical protein
MAHFWQLNLLGNSDTSVKYPGFAAGRRKKSGEERLISEKKAALHSYNRRMCTTVDRNNLMMHASQQQCVMNAYAGFFHAAIL